MKSVNNSVYVIRDMNCKFKALDMPIGMHARCKEVMYTSVKIIFLRYLSVLKPSTITTVF